MLVNNKQFENSASGIKEAARYVKICMPTKGHGYDIKKCASLEEAQRTVYDFNRSGQREAFILKS